jgi:hypothetical protein
MNILDLINQNPKTGRSSSQNFAFKELFKRFDYNSINIVETGCIRNPNDSCDGWGTLLWKKWADASNSFVYSVDNNSHHLFNCMNVVKYSPRVFYIHNDSVEFLKNLPSSFSIQFLFLDSYDYAGDEKNKKLAAEHQLSEIQAAEKNLKHNSLILIDDIFNATSFQGKGELAIPYLLNKKWKIINYSDTQMLLSK